jgi:tetratricopeptide (TPR) repeat protein
MTTATDVYSLGVLLYQLVTGRLPHQDTKLAELLEADGRAAVARPPHLAIETGDPDLRPPGPLRGLRRQLSGDLDAILLRALEPAPSRRYPSVESLGEDLARHLAGLPVRARRGTWAYRSGRYLRRHVVAALLVVAAFTALSGFALATLRQAERLALERDRVTLERNNVQQVTSFLVGIFEVADPWQQGDASTLTARELLDRAAERLDEGLADQPEVSGAARLVIGRVYRNLGLYEPAREHLERVLAARRADDEPVELAESLQELGMLELGRGELARAEELFEHALALRALHLGEAHPETTDTRAELAVTLLYGGRLAEAEALQRRVLSERLSQHGPEHETVALALHNLGGVLNRLGRPAEAEPLLRQALALRRQRWPGSHTMIAANLSSLAASIRAQGDHERAAALFREAVDQAEAIHGPDYPWASISRQSLGMTLLDLGRPEEAEPFLRSALTARRRNMAPGTPWIASAAGSLGACLVALGQLEEAEPLLLESHAIFARNRTREAEVTERALARLRAELRAAGRPLAAERIEALTGPPPAALSAAAP